MELWISGEVSSEVYEAYREARKDIEEKFNSSLAQYDFGSGVKELVFIAMIGAPSDYEEIAKFDKSACIIELRQRADLDRFKTSSPNAQRALLCEALARGISSL